MVLQSTGPISFTQIQTEFGGSNPISLTEYYTNASGGYTTGVSGLPAIGSVINTAGFLGKAKTVSSYITSTSGLVGYYTGESWNGTQWTDLSGSGNNVVTKTGTINSATYPGTTHTYIYGNTAAKLTFPSTILPPTYTLFYVAKYNGTSQGRIFTGPNTVPNWLSGFWMAKTGLAYHNNWLTQSSTNIHSGWFQGTDQNNMYRSAKTNRTIASTGSPSYVTTMTINGGWGGTELSDWAVACVIVYNRTLNSTEYTNIENELATKYVL